MSDTTNGMITLRDGRRFVRLFQTFPGLCDGLGETTIQALAHDFICPVAVVAKGGLDAAAVMNADVRGQVSAAIVADGLIDVRWPAGTRRMLHIHGPGELIDLEPILAENTPAAQFEVRTPVTLALIEDRLGAVVSRHPALAGAVLRWSASQTTLVQAYAAVMGLSRVEDRLRAVLESFAVRWGHVTADGIELVMPITHVDLGQLVGGARPSVSLGLQRLAEEGLVRTAPGNRWIFAAPELKVLPESQRGSLPVRAAVSVLRNRLLG